MRFFAFHFHIRQVMEMALSHLNKFHLALFRCERKKRGVIDSVISGNLFLIMHVVTVDDEVA